MVLGLGLYDAQCSGRFISGVSDRVLSGFGSFC